MGFRVLGLGKSNHNDNGNVCKVEHHMDKKMEHRKETGITMGIMQGFMGNGKKPPFAWQGLAISGPLDTYCIKATG